MHHGVQVDSSAEHKTSVSLMTLCTDSLTRVTLLMEFSAKDQHAIVRQDTMQQKQLPCHYEQTCMGGLLPHLRRLASSCASCSLRTLSVALVLASSTRCASNRARCSARVLSSAASATRWAVDVACMRNAMPHVDSTSCCRLRLFPAGKKEPCVSCLLKPGYHLANLILKGCA